MRIDICDLCTAQTEPHDKSWWNTDEGWSQIKVTRSGSSTSRDFIVCSVCVSKLGLPKEARQTTAEELETLLRELISEEVEQTQSA